DAEANGTRVKPEFGSVWLTMSGPDKDKARVHTTVAVPGATATSMGIPDNNQKGGIWIMNAGTSTAHLMIPGSSPERLEGWKAGGSSLSAFQPCATSAATDAQ